jgi:hypothetical protein
VRVASMLVTLALVWRSWGSRALHGDRGAVWRQNRRAPKSAAG